MLWASLQKTSWDDPILRGNQERKRTQERGWRQRNLAGNGHIDLGRSQLGLIVGAFLEADERSIVLVENVFGDGEVGGGRNHRVVLLAVKYPIGKVIGNCLENISA